MYFAATIYLVHGLTFKQAPHRLSAINIDRSRVFGRVLVPKLAAFDQNGTLRVERRGGKFLVTVLPSLAPDSDLAAPAA